MTLARLVAGDIGKNSTIGWAGWRNVRLGRFASSCGVQIWPGQQLIAPPNNGLEQSKSSL